MPPQEQVTEDTVFRIGSITKTFTAIAGGTAVGAGLVDLEAPANDYLRAFRLVPAKPGLRPATVRHLLTHTAGIGYWQRLSDLLRPGFGAESRRDDRCRPSPTTTAEASPWKSSPGASGCTPTTGSPRSARSSRT